MTRSNTINICVSGQTWFSQIGFVPAVSFSVCIGVNVHTGIDVRSGQGWVVVSAFCLLFPVQLVGRVILDGFGLLVGSRCGVVSVKHLSQGLFLLSGFVTRLSGWVSRMKPGVFVPGVSMGLGVGKDLA